MRAWFSALALLVCLTSTGQARIVEYYDFQTQFRKADLVVIAHPEEKTKPTGEKTTLGGFGNLHTIVVETKFEVSLVFKGDKNLKHFVMHHYWAPEYDNHDVIYVNGPGLMEFDPDSPKGQVEYLLFLIKERDGRYVPLFGQADADLSISKLN